MTCCNCSFNGVFCSFSYTLDIKCSLIFPQMLALSLYLLFVCFLSLGLFSCFFFPFLLPLFLLFFPLYFLPSFLLLFFYLLLYLFLLPFYFSSFFSSFFPSFFILYFHDFFFNSSATVRQDGSTGQLNVPEALVTSWEDQYQFVLVHANTNLTHILEPKTRRLQKTKLLTLAYWWIWKNGFTGVLRKWISLSEKSIIKRNVETKNQLISQIAWQTTTKSTTNNSCCNLWLDY